MLPKYRVVDISRRLQVGKPTNTYNSVRRLELARITFPNQNNQIAHDLTIMSHAGTHVETPAHMGRNGKNVADFAPDTFVGEAVLAEVTHRAPRGSVSAADLENATRGDVRPGDILLVWGRYAAEDRPRISLGAAQWIVAHQVKLLGFDSVDGIDDDAHDVILGNNIPMLEDYRGLEQIHRLRVFLIALPLPIVDLDACPVHAVVLEEVVGG